MTLKTLDNLELKGKKVLLRCDLNVPFDLDGKVLDSCLLYTSPSPRDNR